MQCAPAAAKLNCSTLSGPLSELSWAAQVGLLRSPLAGCQGPWALAISKSSCDSSMLPSWSPRTVISLQTRYYSIQEALWTGQAISCSRSNSMMVMIMIGVEVCMYSIQLSVSTISVMPLSLYQEWPFYGKGGLPCLAGRQIHSSLAASKADRMEKRLGGAKQDTTAPCGRI